MIKPQLRFTQYANSYKVQILNLELLHVKQIQQFQNFVTQRHGYFDFENYSFVIQKRLSYEAFVHLIDSLGIEADIFHAPMQHIQQERVAFGQYKGLLFSELPDSYLLWLQNNYRGTQRSIIEEEIKARNL